MKSVKKNNVQVKGAGTRPMLFAHGFGCDQSAWRFVIPAFEADHLAVEPAHRPTAAELSLVLASSRQ